MEGLSYEGNVLVLLYVSIAGCGRNIHVSQAELIWFVGFYGI